MNQWCKVCDEPAAGFHFGAFTCEGCKSFFGRAHTNPSAAVAIECKTGDGRCVIDKKNRTSCKACRLKKCLAAGMSKSGSRYGRRSNWFKIHCLLQQRPQPRRPPRELDRDDRCGGDSDGRRSADPTRPRAARLPAVPLSPMMMAPLLFGFAPGSWGTPLPRSEHSAFRETARPDGNGATSGRGDDDRPIDLTVRHGFARDDDNNNETVGKYDSALLRLYGHDCADSAVPLDLTRSDGRKFGIRS